MKMSHTTISTSAYQLFVSKKQKNKKYDGGARIDRNEAFDLKKKSKHTGIEKDVNGSIYLLYYVFIYFFSLFVRGFVKSTNERVHTLCRLLCTANKY